MACYGVGMTLQMLVPPTPMVAWFFDYRDETIHKRLTEVPPLISEPVVFIGYDPVSPSNGILCMAGSGEDISSLEHVGRFGVCDHRSDLVVIEVKRKAIEREEESLADLTRRLDKMRRSNARHGQLS